MSAMIPSFFCCLCLCSSLHFMGIYLLRCLITHVTGCVKLTNTSGSWRPTGLACVSVVRLLQRPFLRFNKNSNDKGKYAAWLFPFCLYFYTISASSYSPRPPQQPRVLCTCTQNVNSNWTWLVSQRKYCGNAELSPGSTWRVWGSCWIRCLYQMGASRKDFLTYAGSNPGLNLVL